MTSPLPPALIIFARNPVLGQVKTRLAKDIGNEGALQVYNRLLQHTAQVSAAVTCTRYVYYEGFVPAGRDVWEDALFHKKLQQGAGLGERMLTAFSEVLLEHPMAVIIGSDCFELKPGHIEAAFSGLQQHEVVIGPAQDGGYYLLGMNMPHPGLFEGIEWGTGGVLAQTLAQIEHLRLRHALLEVLHDVDVAADLARYPGLL